MKLSSLITIRAKYYFKVFMYFKSTHPIAIFQKNFLKLYVHVCVCACVLVYVTVQ